MGSIQDAFNYMAGSLADLGDMFVGSVNDAFNFARGSIDGILG